MLLEEVSLTLVRGSRGLCCSVPQESGVWEVSAASFSVCTNRFKSGQHPTLIQLSWASFRQEPLPQGTTLPSAVYQEIKGKQVPRRPLGCRPVFWNVFSRPWSFPFCLVNYSKQEAAAMASGQWWHGHSQASSLPLELRPSSPWIHKQVCTEWL